MDGNAEVVGAYARRMSSLPVKTPRLDTGKSPVVPVLFDWGYFSDHENSFPQELLDSW